MGYVVNHKRIYRLMKMMGLQAVYPKMNLSKRRQKDAVFPYLLKKHPPQNPHDCWNVDITYIKTEKGFVYLTALIDAASRCIMGWHLSNLLDTESCLRALENALKTGYKPQIINSDQGCQFTSESWVWALVEHRIEISMDGKGRWADNIQIERFWRTLKYEEVYLKSYESVQEARESIATYINWYNHERRHSGIEKKRPYDIMTGKVKLAKLCGNVDNANALTHSPTNPTTKTIKQKKSKTKALKLSSKIAA
jgi:putative transposase